MASCKTAVLRTGGVVDTSPPIWELQSTRQRRNVYGRELVLDERFCFATEFPCVSGVYVRKRKSIPRCTWRKHVDVQALW
jgi:hypothetical protein